MPGAGTKQQRSESVDTTIGGDLQITPGAVMSDFEQICVAVPVSGAVIAVRDLAGLLCTVSFGNALAVGSRLPIDPSFTKQCIETGEVVLCDDTESDPRMQLSVAARGNFRSAAAVPIKVQGAVVALIEVFSSQPSGIYPTAIAGLKGVAKSFAALMIFDASNGGQPIVGGSLNRPTILPNPLAKQEPTSVDQEELAPVAEEQTNPTADSPTAVEHEHREEIRRTVANASQLLSDRPTPIRVWIIAGALLFLVALLLLFLFRNTGGN